MNLDPAGLAREYAAGGASAISVLTDRDFFGGSPDDLRRARNAISLPVLRKDFTVCPADVYQSRAMGADAILLIVAALSKAELAELFALGESLGMDVLVEAHDEAEIDEALSVGATLIGVNQRDLRTFGVDGVRAEALAGLIPKHCVKVAESGIEGPGDVARLGNCGYDAVLVGEHLLVASDRRSAVADLVAAVPAAPRAAI